MQTVLTAAVTGHLVFSTLHTNSAAQTIDRIIDTFPEGQARQIRQQLANVLQGVVSLRLVEKADGTGLVAAVEVLRASPRVSKLILEGTLDALEEEIQNSVSYYRMQTMNQSLAALVLNRAISRETALSVSVNPGDLDLMLRKFLYASELGGEAEGADMAEPLSDFSRIVELQEIKKLYDEVQERHSGDLAERDAEIERLRAELQDRDATAAVGDGALDTLRGENERLARQVQLVRQEYDAKIERLNARIRELSGSAPAAAGAAGAAEPEKKGFFRR
jgi:twitching motility protein PilT